MPLFIKTDKDPDGVFVRVDAGLKASDGRCFLVLHRLPPEYAKPPTFVVQLSGDRLEQRGVEDARTYYKAYALQCFSTGELDFLRRARPGAGVVPFFNFSYPNIIRILGKSFYKMTDDEMKPLVTGERYWKLTATDQ